MDVKYGCRNESSKNIEGTLTCHCLWNWYSTLGWHCKAGGTAFDQGSSAARPRHPTPCTTWRPLHQRSYCPDLCCTAVLSRWWPERVLQFISPSRPGDLGSQEGLGWPFITASSVRATCLLEIAAQAASLSLSSCHVTLGSQTHLLDFDRVPSSAPHLWKLCLLHWTSASVWPDYVFTCLWLPWNFYLLAPESVTSLSRSPSDAWQIQRTELILFLFCVFLYTF